jgi:NAD(P)-dependent dehydrogenase (short-subunit alcohol dehydrogenase family)
MMKDQQKAENWLMKLTPFDLSGRMALVTGGSKGIGRAIAMAFAQAGAEVIISARRESDLKSTADEIRRTTVGRVEYCVADMTRREHVIRLADAATKALGRIDILVNNVGNNVVQQIDEIRDADWDRLVEMNLTSSMVLTRALVPGMKERRWGRVIHISSIMALASTPGRNTYSATKAALVGMTMASALDLGPYNVTVNSIAPGPIATEMPMSILSQQQQDALAARTAFNRWGIPDEVAGPAVFLASEAGSYVTGTVLVVDGGALARIF